jgi:uncharacterized protein (DUF342 family)
VIDEAVEPATSPATQGGGSAMADVRRFGEAAVRLGMLSPETVRQVLASAPSNTAGARDIFLRAGALSGEQIEYIETALHFAWERIADKKFGELVVERGWAEEPQVVAAMQVQKLLFQREHKQVPIGEMLVRQRTITAEQRDTILDIQERAKQSAHEPRRRSESAVGGAVRTDAGATDEAVTADSLPDSIEAPASDSFHLLVAEDSLAAFVVVEGEGVPPTVDELKSALQQRGIFHGIDEGALQRVSAGEAAAAGDPVQVAAGEAPRHGSRTRIEYSFDIAPLKVGRESEEGVIDFRDLGAIEQVDVGDVLARKLPGDEGRGGVDVFGKTIPPHQEDEPPLAAGTGTEQLEDGTIVAAESGHPRISATGTVFVYPEYLIDGDLGYNTGHVDFHGRVVVTGTVHAGFRVRCGELVAKELEKAEIEAEGDVFVRDGIIGAHIRAGGSIRARYFREADVEVMGDIAVDKEVVDSRLAAGGAFHGERSTALGSRISARGGIFAGEVGSDRSLPCDLIAGVGNRALEEAERLEAEADTRQAELEHAPEVIAQLRSRRQELDIEIAEWAQVQDRAQVSLRELDEALEAGAIEQGEAAEKRLQFENEAREGEAKVNALFDEQERAMEKIGSLEGDENEIRAAIGTLRAEALRLRDWADANPGTPEIKVRRLLVAGTRLRTPHKEVEVGEDRRNIWLCEIRARNARGQPIWKLSRRRSSAAH